MWLLYGWCVWRGEDEKHGGETNEGRAGDKKMVGVEVAFMEGGVYGVYLYFGHVVMDLLIDIGMDFILFDFTKRPEIGGCIVSRFHGS